MAKPQPPALLVAEKNPLLRRALKALLTEEDRFHPVTLVKDGAAFFKALEKSEPDLALIGWDMPGVSGREILEKLAERKERLPTVVYTGRLSAEVSHQALALGAAGFCSKCEPPEVLLETLHNVAEGRMVFPFMDASRRGRDPFAELTARERELLAALASGLTNAQLAGRFHISLNTVKFHIKNLYDKLGVGNRAQAVARYLKSGD